MLSLYTMACSQFLQLTASRLLHADRSSGHVLNLQLLKGSMPACQATSRLYVRHLIVFSPFDAYKTL